MINRADMAFREVEDMHRRPAEQNVDDQKQDIRFHVFFHAVIFPAKISFLEPRKVV